MGLSEGKWFEEAPRKEELREAVSRDMGACSVMEDCSRQRQLFHSQHIH